MCVSWFSILFSRFYLTRMSRRFRETTKITTTTKYLLFIVSVLFFLLLLLGWGVYAIREKRKFLVVIMKWPTFYFYFFLTSTKLANKKKKKPKHEIRRVRDNCCSRPTRKNKNVNEKRKISLKKLQQNFKTFFLTYSYKFQLCAEDNYY